MLSSANRVPSGGVTEIGVVAVQKGNLSMKRPNFLVSLVATIGAALGTGKRAALAAKPTAGRGWPCRSVRRWRPRFPGVCLQENSRQCDGDFCRGFNRKMRSLCTQVEHFRRHRRRVQLSSEWHDQPRPDYVGGKWAHLRQRGFHCEHGHQSNNSFRKENDPYGKWRLFQSEQRRRRLVLEQVSQCWRDYH